MLISHGKFQQEKYQRKTDLRLFWKINASVGIDYEKKNKKGAKRLVDRPEKHNGGETELVLGRLF